MTTLKIKTIRMKKNIEKYQIREKIV